MIDKTLARMHQLTIPRDELIGDLFRIAIMIRRPDNLGKLSQTEPMKEGTIHMRKFAPGIFNKKVSVREPIKEIAHLSHERLMEKFFERSAGFCHV